MVLATATNFNIERVLRAVRQAGTDEQRDGAHRPEQTRVAAMFDDALHLHGQLRGVLKRGTSDTAMESQK